MFYIAGAGCFYLCAQHARHACMAGGCRGKQRNSQSVFRLVYDNSKHGKYVLSAVNQMF